MADGNTPNTGSNPMDMLGGLFSGLLGGLGSTEVQHERPGQPKAPTYGRDWTTTVLGFSIAVIFLVVIVIVFKNK